MRIRRRTLALFASLLLGALLPSGAWASCTNLDAAKAYQEGYTLQQDGNSAAAARAYQRCLALETGCLDCHYELGWSHWKQGQWKEVIHEWELVLKAEPGHPEISQFLPSAREALNAVETRNISKPLRAATELLTQSVPVDGPVLMTLNARWQSYKKKTASPLDHFDPDIDSPKSILFNKEGNLVFVNSLEAGKTLVYDALGIEKRAVIQHRFGPQSAKLFDRNAPFSYSFPALTANPNVFSGKPVEAALSHQGKYLWVTYYRRSYDPYGNAPSALALIDAKTLKILKVFGTGPISKYVKVSPDGKWLAVSHWGDNTVGLFDISSNDPSQFKEADLLVVESRLATGSLKGNRDRNCGFCVRGLEFSKDSRHLFVSRMRKGGIAVFDLGRAKGERYLGTVFGVSPGPRDLHIDSAGESLYLSCNASGFISKVPVRLLLDKLASPELKPDKRARILPKEPGPISQFLGLGVRSFKLSPDDRYLFAAVNQTSEILVVRTADLKPVARVPVDSYPVGLDLSPDGAQLWVTSQGREGHGGNSVSVYQVRYKSDEVIMRSSSPRRPNPSP